MLTGLNRRTENERLEVSRAAMAAAYPDFDLAYRLDRDRAGNPFQLGVWRGKLSPFGDDYGAVLAHLDHDRNVLVSTNGRLKHDAGCAESHTVPSWLAGTVPRESEFEIVVHYAGAVAHPEARVVKPRLTPGSSGHLNADGTICAYLASEDVWHADRHTVADFLDHVSIWAAKRIVWDATEYWPGAAHDPDTDPLCTARRRSETLNSKMQCPCRSGLSYYECHRAVDHAVIEVRNHVGAIKDPSDLPGALSTVA